MPRKDVIVSLWGDGYEILKAPDGWPVLEGDLDDEELDLVGTDTDKVEFFDPVPLVDADGTVAAPFRVGNCCWRSSSGVEIDEATARICGRYGKLYLVK